MAAIGQTTFSNSFFLMEIYELILRCASNNISTLVQIMF